MIAVSACLCGINTRYNGSNSLNSRILKLMESGKIIPFCPEQLGGLSTPRLPCEISGGCGSDVIEGNAIIIDSKGRNLTDKFLRGAYESIKICRKCNIKTAILKSKSPSCGYGEIYDGSFTGNRIIGNGVTAEIFIRNGIKILKEREIADNLDLIVS
ncbi:DUF523 domain-containing protein [Clostridium sp. LBM24168]